LEREEEGSNKRKENVVNWLLLRMFLLCCFNPIVGQLLVPVGVDALFSMCESRWRGGGVLVVVEVAVVVVVANTNFQCHNNKSKKKGVKRTGVVSCLAC
jgi:hypothetical protein